MRMYVTPRSGLSRAMDRVAEAMTKYAPGHIKIVNTESKADVIVLHAIGFAETIEAIERIQGHKQSFVIIQYCLRSTERPLTRAWLPLWRDALAVWSYYDLRQLAHDDHAQGFDWESEKFNFYHAPMGVDPEIFKPTGSAEKRYTIMTSGYVAQTEGVAETALAVERVNGTQFHLGPEMYLGPHVRCLLGINDERLAYEYTRCKFVAGLRRHEGFELPAVEGLLCGARPVMFDAPHYRAWFNEFAEFIPEGSFDEVVDALESLFRQGPRPVSEAERQVAVERFNWERLMNEFYEVL